MFLAAFILTIESGSKSKKKCTILPPTKDHFLKNHYLSIAKTSGKPSLLSLVPGINQSWYVSGELLKSPTYLYDKKTLSLQFSDLSQIRM